MAAQMKLLSSFAIATNDASWPTVAPTTMDPTMGPSIEPECEWIRNNANTDGEQYAGEVSSMEECVELVQTICEWANIANVHEDVFHGEAGMYGAQTDCWCQQGDDKTVDEWEEYMNCWFEPSGEDHCASHDDCPDSQTFCHHHYCSSCDGCHHCSDGVDETCGSCGEGYPLWEHPSDGTCSPYIPADGCDQVHCTNEDEDCWSGYNFHGHVGECTCDYGWEARGTGRSRSFFVPDYSDWAEVFEYECCPQGTGGAHSDGTCGDYETDDDGCTQTKCTSPANTAGSDCYAGTEEEGCTCSDGWTAEDIHNHVTGPDGLIYYEYTCCPSGGSTDGTCGDFDGPCNQDSCSDVSEDCRAGILDFHGHSEPCTCHDGLESRVTGESEVLWIDAFDDFVEVFHYECCDPGTEGARSDGFCGNYWLDENGCSQSLCTSPSDTPDGDCYAGTRWEGCTCDDGWTAVETGNAGPGSHGHPNYEYTCCPSGGSTDGTCGDFVRHYSEECNQDECATTHGNCWAGTSVGDPCTCHSSLEARETGESVHLLVHGETIELFEFECCESGTPGAHHDGTCGNHETDVAECRGTYEGHLDFDETKYWTFTTPTPDLVTFTNCHSEHDTQMYLLDSSGVDITGQSTNWCDGDDCWDDEHCDEDESTGSETFTIDLSSGTYSLKLMWYDYNPAGNYEVEVFCDSDHCDAHDDCPDSQTFCHYHYCSSCDECHHCSDGVDGTCGSCGEGFPLWEHPSDGTCSPYIPSDGCDQVHCKNDDEDCWSGYNFHGHVGECTCDYGWEARETGRSTSLFVEDYSDWIEMYEYECCPQGTGGAHSDGTCGDYETDDDGCTQTKCTSPANTAGSDCYAGTEQEGCTCSDGWTAEDIHNHVTGPDGLIYYEYTCCPSGGSTDGTCGDFHGPCNQDSCSDYDEDCRAGVLDFYGHDEPCTCHDGLESRVTGESEVLYIDAFDDFVELFHYECCEPGTEGARSDGFCGNYWMDESDCSQSLCTSPSDTPEGDCYAGTRWEGCTCDDGWTAIETGNAGPGSHGHPNYEYTCCPSGAVSGGSTNGTCGDFVRHYSDECNQDSCADAHGSCWAGTSAWDECSCHDGLEARGTGNSVQFLIEDLSHTVELFEFECCERGTRGAHSDGTCGNYETDDDGCTQTKCRSPDNTEGGHCWAGTRSSGCFCDDGWTAVETWGYDYEAELYEYTCCPSGGSTDGSCYDFDPACNQDACADMGEDCNAGFNYWGTWDKCTCNDGFEARETGDSDWVWVSDISDHVEVYEFECCDVGTPRAHSDGTCGDYEVDAHGCTQMKCTSRGSHIEDYDDWGSTCWAGTAWLGCTCDDEWTAIETGISRVSDDGEMYYEYTCCPSGGTTNGTCGDFVRRSDDGACNQHSCADYDENCWAGYDLYPVDEWDLGYNWWDECTCHDGLEARETGQSVIVESTELFEFECCVPGTASAHSDGTCGNHETDWNGCTQTKCMSPHNTGGGHCWAGTTYSGCWCDDGWTAVETGRDSGLAPDGRYYHEYTCCPSGGSTDGRCGDFDPDYRCNQDSCSDMNEDCWAGFNFWGTWDDCTCDDGLEAREIGSKHVWVEETSVYVEVFQFECCDPGMGGAHRDGTCGNHDTDENGCTQTKCTSEAEDGEGGDCYAGTKWEGCTCSDGWTAVETGNAGPDLHGHATYEYTCCPSGGTTNGTCGDFVRRYSEHCNQDSCHSDEDSSDEDSSDEDKCVPWGGFNVDETWYKCLCQDGLEARETGESVHIWEEDGALMLKAFEYECCDRGTGGAHTDGTCGDYETDNDGCSQMKCTSPANTAGFDCYAGTAWEPCTCSDGWTAVETGRQVVDDGNVLYEYTCCQYGGSIDGRCGAFVPTVDPTEHPSNSPTINPSELPSLSPSESPSVSPSNSPSDSPSNSPSESPSAEPTENPSDSPTLSPSVDEAANLSDSSGDGSDGVSNLGAIIIFAVFAVLCLSGIAYYCGRCQRKRERIPSKAIPINPAQPIATAEGTDPSQQLQWQYSGKASPMDNVNGISKQSMGASQQVLHVPPAGPPDSVPVPHAQWVQPPEPQDVVQMVMGQNGQWVMMQQPQSVQQMQPRPGDVQQQAPQQMQFVYRMQEERASNVASTDQAPPAPINVMQQFQYVQPERQRPSGDDTIQ